LQTYFDNILEFSKIKDKCIFCDHSLNCELTSFNDLKESVIPSLNVPIKNNSFSFRINHTTENYDIKADIIIDIISNKIKISIPEYLMTSLLDKYVAINALHDMKPCINVYCNNKLCKNKYSIVSHILDIRSYENYLFGTDWEVMPIKLYLEFFKTNKFLVQNNWIIRDTSIFSLQNTNSIPIKIEMLDFEAMGPLKLLQRVNTIIVFS